MEKRNKRIFSNFLRIKLKVKNSYKARLKHIKSIVYNEYELNIDEDELIGMIFRKLFNEGYDLEDNETLNEFIPIIKDFQDNYLEEMIDVMASDSSTKINNFISKL